MKEDMPEAELKITHVSYPINSKADAFLYNFLEGLGRASGWILVMGLVVLFIKYMDSETSDATETKIEQHQ